MTQKVEKYRINHEDGKGYSIYTKKNGRCFIYSNNWDERRGLLVLSPSHRIPTSMFEQDRVRGMEI